MDSNHASFRVGCIPCSPTPWLFFRKGWAISVSVSWTAALMTRSYGNSLLSLQVRQTVFWAALEGMYPSRPERCLSQPICVWWDSTPTVGSSSKAGDSLLAVAVTVGFLYLHALQWVLLLALGYRSMRLFCRLCKGLCFLASCCFLISIPYLSPFQVFHRDFQSDLRAQAQAQMVQTAAPVKNEKDSLGLVCVWSPCC